MGEGRKTLKDRDEPEIRYGADARWKRRLRAAGRVACVTKS